MEERDEVERRAKQMEVCESSSNQSTVHSDGVEWLMRCAQDAWRRRELAYREQLANMEEKLQVIRCCAFIFLFVKRCAW